MVFLASWSNEFEASLYDYYQSSIGKTKAELYDPITESRLGDLLLKLESLTAGRKMLDVGCGQGHWVDFAVRNNWAAAGIDLASHAVTLCQSLGLPVSRTDIFSPELTAMSYDVVTMFEVIEHVPNPVRFLDRGAELLKKGGVLLLSTPNFASLDRRLLGSAWEVIHPEHLSYFSPGTLLGAIAATSKLEPIKIVTRNSSVSANYRALRGRIRSAKRNNANLETAPPPTAKYELRRLIERSALLRFAKHCINSALSASQLGSDMSAWCRRV